MKKNKYSSEEKVQDKINEFSSLSEDELINQMFHYAKEGKKDGSINDASLEDFYNKASMFLSAEQKGKLRHLIDTIKSS